MHHYCTNTYQALSYSESSQVLARTVLPQYACSSPHLMHAILATSALHIAHLDPRRSDHYSLISAHHQVAAISGFRTLLSNITSQTSGAILALGFLITLLAISATAGPNASHLDGLIEYVVTLNRGLPTLLSTANCETQQSNGDPLVKHVRECQTIIPAELPSWLRAQFDGLAAWVGCSSSVEMTALAREALQAEVGRLSEAYGRTLARPGVRTAATLFRWVIPLDEEVVGLIRRKEPHALAVLAHFCALLHHYGDIWYLHGKGARVVNEIQRLAGGNAEHMKWMRWPSQYVASEKNIGAISSILKESASERVSE